MGSSLSKGNMIQQTKSENKTNHLQTYLNDSYLEKLRKYMLRNRIDKDAQALRRIVEEKLDTDFN